MKVVFDAGVVFSGAGWRGEAHLCLNAMARRRVIAFATPVRVRQEISYTFVALKLAWGKARGKECIRSDTRPTE